MSPCASHRSRRVCVALVVLAVLSFGLLQLRADVWRSVGSGKNIGISGIGLVSESPQSDKFIVLHDNKRPGEARLGLLTAYMKRLRYDTVQWRGKDPEPADLEAMAPLGRLSKRGYLVMTSSGQVYHLGFSSSFRKAKVLSKLEVPAGEPGANYEGLAIWPQGDRGLVAWGHRGKMQSPGILYWGWLDLKAETITWEGQANITVPWPESSTRHISDLAIDNGQLYVSAASDPGDSGPFTGALYSAGKFTVVGDAITFKADLAEIYRSEAHKIEAITRVKSGFVLASDDENKGAAFRIYMP